jgi:hypothetical protein
MKIFDWFPRSYGFEKLMLNPKVYEMSTEIGGIKSKHELQDSLPAKAITVANFNTPTTE